MRSAKIACADVAANTLVAMAVLLLLPVGTGILVWAKHDHAPGNREPIGRGDRRPPGPAEDEIDVGSEKA